MTSSVAMCKNDLVAVQKFQLFSCCSIYPRVAISEYVEFRTDIGEPAHKNFWSGGENKIVKDFRMKAKKTLHLESVLEFFDFPAKIMVFSKKVFTWNRFRIFQFSFHNRTYEFYVQVLKNNLLYEKFRTFELFDQNPECVRNFPDGMATLIYPSSFQCMLKVANPLYLNHTAD